MSLHKIGFRSELSSRWNFLTTLIGDEAYESKIAKIIDY
jgi:hypothetical protein